MDHSLCFVSYHFPTLMFTCVSLLKTLLSNVFNTATSFKFFVLILQFKDDYFNLYISSQTDDAVIYYTTDGSKPDENSNIYQNFISIDNNLLTNGTQTPD